METTHFTYVISFFLAQTPKKRMERRMFQILARILYIYFFIISHQQKQSVSKYLQKHNPIQRLFFL